MNEEIIGALRSATNRGETLQQAMITLFNAGYKKEEIEESARVFQQRYNPNNFQETPVSPKKNVKNSIKKKNLQKVSKYAPSSKEDKFKKILLLLIAITSVLFIGLLIFFFLF